MFATPPKVFRLPKFPKLTEDNIRTGFLELKPGEAVTAGVPQIFGISLPTDSATDRLALARWLVDRRNPLS